MSHDVVVIGGGVNGLAAAAKLARSGRKVLLLEQRNRVGGLAVGVDIADGLTSAGVLSDTTHFSHEVARDLGLKRHGLCLRPKAPDVLGLSRDGKSLLLSGDTARTTEEIRKHSTADADAYGRYCDFIRKIGPVIRKFFTEAPHSIVDIDTVADWEVLKSALRLRMLGAKDMLELLRLPSMCVGDWLSEWFASDLLRAMLATPAVAGTWSGPRSPGTNGALLRLETTRGTGVEGGAAAIVSALEKALRERGGEIRTGAKVERILTDGEKSDGVALEGGEEIRAHCIAATCDPKQLFSRLVPRGLLPSVFEHRIAKFRSRGTTAQMVLALKAPLRYKARAEPVEHARLASDLVELEKSFDAVKYRRMSDRPVLEVFAPSGMAKPVVSVLVHFAPYSLEPKWEEGQRERLTDRVVKILGEYAPTLPGSIVAQKVLSPVDLEREYCLTEGHIHHGEHGLDQLLVRPTPESAGYRSPIAGLHPCGSGSHPGGGLTGLPGLLGARAILEDRPAVGIF